MSEITFRGRWREELVAESAEGKLVFELTMGKACVYFPSQARWLAVVPPWARERWQVYVDACRAWCGKGRIPLVVVDDAHVSEER
ncbi:MAG TPA: hypothetical protein VFZ65_09420 [Planctomycetota bacterium]|nr:hypothetical protein [Planctomycetota bacterium]